MTSPLTPTEPIRLAYGPDGRQHLDLYPAPEAGVRGTVVLIHGGFWRAGLGSDNSPPMARALNRLKDLLPA